jgi:hypothetical protein
MMFFTFFIYFFSQKNTGARYQVNTSKSKRIFKKFSKFGIRNFRIRIRNFLGMLHLDPDSYIMKRASQPCLKHYNECKDINRLTQRLLRLWIQFSKFFLFLTSFIYVNPSQSIKNGNH